MSSQVENEYSYRGYTIVLALGKKPGGWTCSYGINAGNAAAAALWQGSVSTPHRTKDQAIGAALQQARDEIDFKLGQRQM